MFKAFSLAAVLLAGTALTAQAAPTVFTGSSGSLSASASFEIVGTDLVVTLTNTGGSDVTAANEVLTGVFFDLGGGTGLTLAKTSAVVAAGSSLVSTTALPVPATPGWLVKRFSNVKMELGVCCTSAAGR